jgi:hypothetical protein
MRGEIKDAAEHAFWLVSNDTKFVRLTTITTIIHSIIFLCYVGISARRVIASDTWGSWGIWDILRNAESLFRSSGLIGRAIGIGIILAIWYFLMPPIGDSALIHYLSSEEKRWSVSLGKWFISFFPMFEYNSMMSFFSMLPFFIVVSRFWTLDLLDNILIIIILSLRGTIIFFASVFLPYTKYFIVLDDLKPIEAMKKSMNLALENFWVSIRWALLQYALSFRFIINILLFLGLPLLILYASTAFDFNQWGPLATLIIIVSVGVWLLTAYVNWIIEAFFITLWHRLFVQIKK